MSEAVEMAVNYQCLRSAELLLKYLEKPRETKPKVYWFWGSTGTGKSKTATERWPGSYYVGSNAKWWCGYDRHKTVIWDDFRPTQIGFPDLLRMLDWYPFRVETKGGQRQLVAEVICFTCPKHPKDCYEVEEDVQQLLRRIDHVEHFN